MFQLSRSYLETSYQRARRVKYTVHVKDTINLEHLSYFLLHIDW